MTQSQPRRLNWGPRFRVTLIACVMFAATCALCWYDVAPAWWLPIAGAIAFAAHVFATLNSIEFGQRNLEKSAASPGWMAEICTIEYPVFLALIWLPVAQLVIARAASGGALGSGWLLTAVQICLLLAFGWALIAALVQAVEQSVDPWIAYLLQFAWYASLAIFLGDKWSFGYLAHFLPDSFLDLNHWGRLGAIVLFATALVLAVLIFIFARFRDGDPDFPDFEPSSKHEEPLDDLDSLSQLGRAVVDVTFFAFDILSYTLNVLRWLGTLIVLACCDVFVAIFKPSRLIMTATLTGLLTFTLLVVNFAPDARLLMNQSRYVAGTSLAQLVAVTIFFGWLLLSMIGAAFVSTNTGLKSYRPVHTFFLGIFGIWIFLVIAHLFAATGLLDLPGFGFSTHDFFLIGFAFLLLMAFAIVKASANRIYLLALLAVLSAGGSWIAWLVLVEPAAPTPLAFAPLTPALSDMPEGQDAASAGPRRQGTAPSDDDGGSLTSSWLDGSWGVDGDCGNRMTIRVGPDALDVTFMGKSRRVLTLYRNPTSVSTDEGTYSLNGDQVSLVLGKTISRLSRC